MGAGAPAHLSIFFPRGLAVAVSECRPLPGVRAGAFSNSAHPDDDAKHGRLRNPTGHGGVYKVDGHGRPEPSVGGGELNFFFHAMGAGAPAHLSIFFPRGLPRCDPRRLRQIAFWVYPQGYAAVVLTVQQKFHVVSRFLSMCYDGRFCYCMTRCMIGAVSY